MRDSTPPQLEPSDGTKRSILPEIGSPPDPERLAIEKTGCYALPDEENNSIKVFNAQDNELFALSRRAVSFESKPLFLFLQVYVLGVNNGRSAATTELKQKISELVKLIF